MSRTSIASFLALVLFVHPPATAQQRTGIGAVDSAAVARESYRLAAGAMERGDLAAVREAVKRASTAWPTQEAYLWSRASFAARAHDTADVIRSLAAYAALGLGRDLRSSHALGAMATVPAVASIAQRLDANRAPLAASRQRGMISDSTFYPEGMDVDSVSGRIYVASIRHGTIAELGADGQFIRQVLPAGTTQIGGILGVRVDPRRDVIWATTSALPQSKRYATGDSVVAALLQIRRSDGTIVRRWDLPPSPAGHILGDLAIGPNGDVFFTDSNEPYVYRLRPAADTLERQTSPYFHSLQGLAPTPDGEVLYLADYSHGLLRMDLRTGDVVRLTDAPSSTSLGCDGIVWYQHSIVAVQNGVDPARVVRFALDADGLRITRVDVLDRNTRVADEPTIGALRGAEFLYVANSQWNKYADNGTRRPEVPLAPTIILGVSLTSRP
ncbi:MAG: hypothetical protein U0132_19325 [Gemmatimonadaceae bacterium]